MSDDEVGYGKPPKKHQFQKGQSGNPKGRKKGARGLKTDLQAELVSKMTIQINGKAITATKQRLMLKTLTARAAAGDTRSTDKLVDIIAKVIGVEDSNADASRLSKQDEALFKQLIDTRGGTDSEIAIDAATENAALVLGDDGETGAQNDNGD